MRTVSTNTPVASLPRPSVTTAAPLKVPSATPTSQTTWETVSLLVGSGQPGRLYAFQYDYASPGILAGHARLLVSDDNAATWLLFPGGLPSGNAQCLHDVNLDYATRDSVFVSTCHGLEHWSGTRWEIISSKETVRVAIVYGDPKSIWAVTTTDPGLISRSGDGGATWIPADGGTAVFGSIDALAIDPRGGKTLYAVRSSNCCGRALIRGTLAGEWIDLPAPVASGSGPFVTGLVIDGATGTLYVSATNADHHGEIWKTLNPGEPDVNKIIWTQVHDFGAQFDVRLMAAGAGPAGAVLYAAVENYPSPITTERSADGGQTWLRLKIP